MTIYYGVWSGDEWWNIGNEVFHTTVLGLAEAQAMVVNAMWKRNMMHSRRRHELWGVRAIGEDGLPVTKPLGAKAATSLQDEMDWMKRGAELDGMLARAEAEERSRPRLLVCKPCDLEACKAVVDASEERHQIRSEAASHKCGICGDVATNWIELCGCKAYLCDQHEEWRTFFRAGRLFCVPKEKEP